MTASILAIAAEFEKPYLDEWIAWHLDVVKYDKIYLIANNWTYYPKDHRVLTWRIDGLGLQLKAYNDVLASNVIDTDFVSIIDCDEFVVPFPKFNDVKEMFQKYSSMNAIALNWRMFGSSGLHFDGQNYSVIDRFVYRQKGYNNHVKTSLNLRLLKLNALSPKMDHDPHHSNIEHFSINSQKVIFNSPFNEQHLSDDCPYIAHFFTKTPEEWNSRRSVGRIDVSADSPGRFRSFSEFKQHDLNEVLDTTLKDKLHAMMESQSIQ